MALNDARLSVAAKDGDRYLFVRDLPENAKPGDVCIVAVDEVVYTVRVLYAGALEILATHDVEIRH